MHAAANSQEHVHTLPRIAGICWSEKEFEERVGNLDQPGKAKSQRVRDAVERKVKPFRIVEIERECPDVSRETIRLVLRAMKKEGLIEPKGRGRGVRWRKLK